LNDEAAMPILHRLARAYDWGYPLLSESERAKVRAMMLRRAQDCWKGSQTREGAGHLNRPYNSHGNRSWHKMAENAVATFGETPESELFLRFAVTKFFAAYPVWSDDDGGWHEGLSYWAGYMVKTTWWMDLARTALGIDGFRKPFFTHFAEYGMYTAPPGSPNMGFGDLAFRPVQPSWSFVWYFTRAAKNQYWAWWAQQWNIRNESDEPVLGFLWGAMGKVEPKEPTALPSSRVFHGIGVAILNSTLLDAADNVQVRLKSSPMGRRSHGHDPHNSFTLNAYGEALLMNNVYRDLHGSEFHRGWVYNTRAQNALLVDGEGQPPAAPQGFGRIVHEKFAPEFDYVAGEAAAAYQGRLKKFLRHVVLVKPDLVIVADEIEAVRPSTFQWMLHGAVEFSAKEAKQQLRLERERAGVVVEYAAFEPLRFRQWTGYDPPPDTEYLKSVGNAQIPEQWHVEAATVTPRQEVFTVAVIRPYRKDAAPQRAVSVLREGAKVIVLAAGKQVELRGGADFVQVTR
jgi:hypothetical protein